MAKKRDVPVDPADDDERGSWHLRSGGAWVFALALWIAGIGGIAIFARDAIDVGLARLTGIKGTVTIQQCAHTRSYALCYGPFDATNGSVHRKRLELRTLQHDQPGRHEPTWLRNRSATHAWASDVSPWGQLIPVAPFALLALVQTLWLVASWRAWRRRRRARKRDEWAPGELGTTRLTEPPPRAPTLPGAAFYPSAGTYPVPSAGSYPAAPSAGSYSATGRARPGTTEDARPAATGRVQPAATGRAQPRETGRARPAETSRAYPPDPGVVPRPSAGRVYRSAPARDDHADPPAERDSSQSSPVADQREWERWQDRRGTAAPPGLSAPELRARRPPWERPEDG